MHARLVIATALITSMSSFGAAAIGQELLWEIPGARDSLAVFITDLDDIDGDGHKDFVVGAPEEAAQGTVRAYSGRTGQILWERFGAARFDWFGHSVSSLGDVNGDGVSDVAAGSPSADVNGMTSGSAYVLSGQDGSVLHIVHGTSGGVALGHRVNDAGDVDADGTPDFLVYTENEGPTGRTYVHSGADASELYRFDHLEGPFYNFQSGIGDVDADGHDDVMVGSPFADGPNGEALAGKAVAYSGKDGSVLFTLTGGELDALGASIDGLGDLDRDGHDDFLVGAFNANGTGDMVGEVYVYSGANQSILYTLRGDVQSSSFGLVASNAHDVNADGVTDFVVNANRLAYGEVSVFSGATGQRLYQFDGNANRDALIFATGAGDLNGDGIGDLLLSSHAGGDGLVQARAGNDVWLSAKPKQPKSGDTATLTTREGTPGDLALTVATSVGGIDVFILLGGVATVDGTGAHTISGIVPPGLSGLSVEFQSFIASSSTLGVSSIETMLFE